MSHFEVRSQYTSELGKALARVFDTNVYRTIVKTARADSTLAGASSTSPFPDGTIITSADVTGTIAAAGGEEWHEVMRDMQVDADQRNYDGDIWLAVPPATFDGTAYSQAGGAAANPFMFADRRTMTGEGFGQGMDTLQVRKVRMFMSNLIPQANDSANADVKAKYRADFSTTLGVGWGREGVGTVKLIGMGIEQTRDVRRQEDFVVAKIAVGHGPLRNEITWEVTA